MISLVAASLSPSKHPAPMVSTATVFIKTNRRHKKRGNTPPATIKINDKKNRGMDFPLFFQSPGSITGWDRRSSSGRHLAIVTGIPMSGQTTMTNTPKITIRMALAMAP